jgi:hypothetical protein
MPDENRITDIHSAMAERAEAAAKAGEPDELRGWLTVLIQDFTELKARVEDLERRVGDESPLA